MRSDRPGAFAAGRTLTNVNRTGGPVCVLGAGTTGRGIAHACAVAGREVRLRDVDADALSRAVGRVHDLLDRSVERGELDQAAAADAFDRLIATDDLPTAVSGAAAVVEAVPEDLELKRAVLSEAEAHAPDAALLASNTSSLPLTSIAAALEAPGRGVGLHFPNPVAATSLVEVVLAEQTATPTRERAEAFVAELDRTAITVDDTPGFATSRLGAAQAAEAIRMLERGVASAHDIDAGMELGYDHPVGPLELTDRVGLDVRLDVLDRLRDELGERFTPRRCSGGRCGRGSSGGRPARGSTSGRTARSRARATNRGSTDPRVSNRCLDGSHIPLVAYYP